MHENLSDWKLRPHYIPGSVTVSRETLGAMDNLSWKILDVMAAAEEHRRWWQSLPPAERDEYRRRQEEWKNSPEHRSAEAYRNLRHDSELYTWLDPTDDVEEFAAVLPKKQADRLIRTARKIGALQSELVALLDDVGESEKYQKRIDRARRRILGSMEGL